MYDILGILVVLTVFLELSKDCRYQRSMPHEQRFYSKLPSLYSALKCWRHRQIRWNLYHSCMLCIPAISIQFFWSQKITHI